MTLDIRGQDDFFFYGFENTEALDRWVIRQQPGSRFNLENLRFEVIPEPSTLALLAVGAVGLVGYTWRRRRRAG